MAMRSRPAELLWLPATTTCCCDAPEPGVAEQGRHTHHRQRAPARPRPPPHSARMRAVAGVPGRLDPHSDGEAQPLRPRTDRLPAPTAPKPHRRRDREARGGRAPVQGHREQHGGPVHGLDRSPNHGQASMTTPRRGLPPRGACVVSVRMIGRARSGRPDSTAR